MDDSSRILSVLEKEGGLSSTEIHDRIASSGTIRTTQRILKELIAKKLIDKEGNYRSTRYRLGQSYRILHSIDVDDYFARDIDERNSGTAYNRSLIRKDLYEVAIFTSAERAKLTNLQQIYAKNIEGISLQEYQREVERLAIDLSWKSSQIEGNTYTLLETERLLKEKQTAAGRSKDEAVMLLNHKEAIDFIVSNPRYLDELSVRKIEDIHSSAH